MDEKIKVAIAGYPGELAMQVALAVCQSNDMELLGYGLSDDNFPNRHDKIACVYTEMYNQDRIPLFLAKEMDVLVDCFLSDNQTLQKMYTESNVPVVLMAAGFKKDGKNDIVEILDNIRMSYEMKQRV